MKGLLIKDLRILLQNKTAIIVIFIVVAILAMQMDNEIDFDYLTGYIALVYGFFAMNTISADENDKSIGFLITLPITRGLYVLEKYIFMISCSFFGGLMAVVLSIVLGHPSSIANLLLRAVTVCLVLIVFQLFMFPIQLKLGHERGRIMVMIALMFLLSVGKGAITKFYGTPEGMKRQMMNAVSGGMPGNRVVLWACLAVVWGFCFALSLFISRGIMRRKEF